MGGLGVCHPWRGLVDTPEPGRLGCLSDTPGPPRVAGRRRRAAGGPAPGRSRAGAASWSSASTTVVGSSSSTPQRIVHAGTQHHVLGHGGPDQRLRVGHLPGEPGQRGRVQHPPADHPAPARRAR